MLKRYHVGKDEPLGGWAIIVLDTEIGFFATVSDYGNYSYVWSSPGGEFRKFLCGVHTDYLYGKLTHVQDVYDDEATKTAILARIEESKRSLDYELEQRIFTEHDFDGEEGFNDWACNTSIDRAWELQARRPEPQCWHFCEKTFPRFQKMLEEELVAEAMDLQALKELHPVLLQEVHDSLPKVDVILGLRTGKYR